MEAGRTSTPARNRSVACYEGTAITTDDGYEGARSGNVIGTYLHGPLLPKNSWFADWLIQAALGLEQPLSALEDDLEVLAPTQTRPRAAGL